MTTIHLIMPSASPGPPPVVNQDTGAGILLTMSAWAAAQESFKKVQRLERELQYLLSGALAKTPTPPAPPLSSEKSPGEGMVRSSGGSVRRTLSLGRLSYSRSLRESRLLAALPSSGTPPSAGGRGTALAAAASSGKWTPLQAGATQGGAVAGEVAGRESGGPTGSGSHGFMSADFGSQYSYGTPPSVNMDSPAVGAQSPGRQQISASAAGAQQGGMAGGSVAVDGGPIGRSFFPQLWPIAHPLTSQEQLASAPPPNMIPAQTGPTDLGLPPQQLPFWLPAASPAWALPPSPPPPAAQLPLMRHSGTPQSSTVSDLWNEMEASREERTKADADARAARLEAIRAEREAQPEPSASPRLPSPTPSPSKPSWYL